MTFASLCPRGALTCQNARAQALPILGRASQCVVVGDDKQLPPRDPTVTGLLDDCLRGTERQFPLSKPEQRMLSAVESTAEPTSLALGDKQDQAPPEPETGLRGRLPLVPLTVHYRSGHQSLIAVSNELFYGGTLTSFPSAHDLPAPPLPARRPRSEAAGQPGDGDGGIIGGAGGSDDEASSDGEGAAASDNGGDDGDKGGHGLVRVEVGAGRMESNGPARDFVEASIAAAVQRLCPRDLHTLGGDQGGDQGGGQGGVAFGGLVIDAPEGADAGRCFGETAVAVSYSTSPQGYINVAQVTAAWCFSRGEGAILRGPVSQCLLGGWGQAEAVFADVVAYMTRVNGVSGPGTLRPLSMGVITLNRPQRALLHAFVHAARHRLGLVPLSQVPLPPPSPHAPWRYPLP